MATPLLPPAPPEFVQVTILFNPGTGELRVKAPPAALMLALAMLELARHEITKKIFEKPPAIMPARSFPRIS